MGTNNAKMKGGNIRTRRTSKRTRDPKHCGNDPNKCHRYLGLFCGSRFGRRSLFSFGHCAGTKWIPGKNLNHHLAKSSVARLNIEVFQR